MLVGGYVVVVELFYRGGEEVALVGVFGWWFGVVFQLPITAAVVGCCFFFFSWCGGDA